MTRSELQVNLQGRVTIPAALRNELGFEPGTTVVAYVEAGRLVLEHRAHLLNRLQNDVLAAAARSGATGSAVDSLIADRRAEAADDGAGQ
jgi:AbrB family looped-hinge helix DNA binding protein